MMTQVGDNGTSTRPQNRPKPKIKIKVLPDAARAFLEVGPVITGVKRLVIARVGTREVHRDRFDTHSSAARKKFLKEVASRLRCEIQAISSLDAAICHQTDEADQQSSEEATSQSNQRQMGQDAVGVLAARLELFQTADLAPFARMQADNHYEVMHVRSKKLRNWLAGQLYEITGKPPSAQQIDEALQLLEFQAVYEGPSHDVFVRLAAVDGAIYLDLANDKWQVAKVTSEGWRIVDQTDVRFRRPNGMRSLPTPVLGGSIEDLRGFLNIAADDFKLMVGTIIGMFNPVGTLPVVAFCGSQDSAKSTQTKIIKSLIDPDNREGRAQPREIRDLMISAIHSGVLAFDNLSSLPEWLSDALCRLVSGGSVATRELYADTEEVILSARRPLIINGIEDLATRGDLLSRTIQFVCPAIKKRRSEQEFWSSFELARSKILGCLLTGVATAMSNVEGILATYDDLPRLSDFAAFAMASMPAFGWKPDDFLDTYNVNQERASVIALEASVVFEPLRQFMNHQPKWEGTAAELLNRLTTRFDGHGKRRPVGWPKTPGVLSGLLRRLQPNLKQAGIEIVFDRDGSRANVRTISITKVPLQVEVDT